MGFIKEWGPKLGVEIICSQVLAVAAVLQVEPANSACHFVSEAHVSNSGSIEARTRLSEARRLTA